MHIHRSSSHSHRWTEDTTQAHKESNLLKSLHQLLPSALFSCHPRVVKSINVQWALRVSGYKSGAVNISSVLFLDQCFQSLFWRNQFHDLFRHKTVQRVGDVTVMGDSSWAAASVDTKGFRGEKSSRRELFKASSVYTQIWRRPQVFYSKAPGARPTQIAQGATRFIINSKICREQL